MTYLETAAFRIANAEPCHPQTYWDRLAAHTDWLDDADVEELRAQATLSDEHCRLFIEFRAHHLAKAFKRETVPPIPARPEMTIHDADAEAVAIREWRDQ